MTALMATTRSIRSAWLCSTSSALHPLLRMRCQSLMSQRSRYRSITCTACSKESTGKLVSSSQHRGLTPSGGFGSHTLSRVIDTGDSPWNSRVGGISNCPHLMSACTVRASRTGLARWVRVALRAEARGRSVSRRPCTGRSASCSNSFASSAASRRLTLPAPAIPPCAVAGLRPGWRRYPPLDPSPPHISPPAGPVVPSHTSPWPQPSSAG